MAPPWCAVPVLAAVALLSVACVGRGPDPVPVRRAPPPPRGPVTGVEAVVGPGVFVVGAAGEAWEVASSDRPTAVRWRHGDRIEVRAAPGTPPFSERLVNRSRGGEQVAVRRGRRLD